MNDELKKAIDQVFPVQEGPFKLEILDVTPGEEGQPVRLLVRLIEFSDGILTDVREQQCDAEVGADTVDEFVELILERMRSIESPFMPDELLFPRTPYEPVDPADEYGVWFSNVLGAMREQAQSRGFKNRLRVVAQWDVVPRTVFFLDLIGSMAGGNGFEVFFDQHDADVVRAGLEALDEVGCDRLARVYRQALDLAARRHFDCAVYADQAWLTRERLNAPKTSGPNPWKAIDSWEPHGTWTLIKEELQPTLAEYVERHRRELVT